MTFCHPAETEKLSAESRRIHGTDPSWKPFNFDKLNMIWRRRGTILTPCMQPREYKILSILDDFRRRRNRNPQPRRPSALKKKQLNPINPKPYTVHQKPPPAWISANSSSFEELQRSARWASDPPFPKGPCTHLTKEFRGLGFRVCFLEVLPT